MEDGHDKGGGEEERKEESDVISTIKSRQRSNDVQTTVWEQHDFCMQCHAIYEIMHWTSKVTPTTTATQGFNNGLGQVRCQLGPSEAHMRAHSHL